MAISSTMQVGTAAVSLYAGTMHYDVCGAGDAGCTPPPDILFGDVMMTVNQTGFPYCPKEGSTTYNGGWCQRGPVTNSLTASQWTVGARVIIRGAVDNCRPCTAACVATPGPHCAVRGELCLFFGRVRLANVLLGDLR